MFTENVQHVLEMTMTLNIFITIFINMKLIMEKIMLEIIKREQVLAEKISII